MDYIHSLVLSKRAFCEEKYQLLMSIQQSNVPLCGLYTLILRTDLLMTELLLSEKLFFFLQNPSESWVDFFSNNPKTFQIM